MNKTQWIVLAPLAALLALGAFVALFPPASVAAPATAGAAWEYKVVRRLDIVPARGPLRTTLEFDPEKDPVAFQQHAVQLEAVLNRFGAEGWQLCSYTPNQREYVFKRQAAQ